MGCQRDLSAAEGLYKQGFAIWKHQWGTPHVIREVISRCLRKLKWISFILNIDIYKWLAVTEGLQPKYCLIFNCV